MPEDWVCRQCGIWRSENPSQQIKDRESGLDLALSEETKKEFKEIDDNIRAAHAQAPFTLFD